MTFAISEHVRDLETPLTGAMAALGLPPMSGQSVRLLAYVSLLQRWNSVHNLSGAQDAGSLLREHVLDCLAAVPPLSRYAAGRPLRLLDAGTGAGLPAVVLASMFPSWTITAVDSVGKKVAFLRQVVGELHLANLHPVHGRLEDRAGHQRHDVVTSRAFSSLRQLVDLTRSAIEPSGVWVAMKGKMPEGELRELPADCHLFHVEPLLVPGLNAERCLVWMRPASNTPSI